MLLLVKMQYGNLEIVYNLIDLIGFFGHCVR